MRFYMVVFYEEYALMGDHRYERSPFTSLAKAKLFASKKWKDSKADRENDNEYSCDIRLYQVDVPKTSNKKQVLSVAGDRWIRYGTLLVEYGGE